MKESLLKRIQYNYKRLFITAVVILAVLILVIFLIPSNLITPTNESNNIDDFAEYTYQDTGFGNITDLKKPVSYTFNDPVKTPEVIVTYGIEPGPDVLFGTSSIRSIASSLGFTSAASVVPIANGYYYTEEGLQLSILPLVGKLNFSSSHSTLNTINTETISPDQAITNAKAIVSNLGFSSPIYDWNNVSILPFSIGTDGPTEELGITPRGYYKITIPLKLNNLPVLFPEEVYIHIYADGKAIGANLWYPNFYIDSPIEQEVIPYLTAINRVENGDGIYRGTFNNSSSITFNTTSFAYIVPNQFLQNPIIDTRLVPAYVFEADTYKVYVSALE